MRKIIFIYLVCFANFGYCQMDTSTALKSVGKNYIYGGTLTKLRVLKIDMFEEKDFTIYGSVSLKDGKSEIFLAKKREVLDTKVIIEIRADYNKLTAEEKKEILKNLYYWMQSEKQKLANE